MLTSFRPAGFTKTPTLQGLSAVALLNTFYASWGGGQFLDAAVSFNLVALSAAWEMELVSRAMIGFRQAALLTWRTQHRDPDELDTHFTPLDAEMRRRVFWALFSLDT